MITAQYLSIVLALGQSSPDAASHSWPLALATSKIARQSDFVKRLEAAQAQPPASFLGNSLLPTGSTPSGETPASTEPASTNVEIHSHHRLPPAYLAQLRAEGASMLAERDAALALERAGKYDDAKKRLEIDLMTTPKEFFAIPLMNIELSHGDYTSAYKVAVPFIKPGRISQELLIRASLAASSLGEVYPGQRSFLISAMPGINATDEFAVAMPSGDAPTVIAAISQVLLGLESYVHGDFKPAIPHFEAAWAADPGNPAICYWLGRCYTGVMQYSRAISKFEAGVSRSGTGTLHHSINIYLQLAKSNLMRFGDGHFETAPLPPPKPTTTIHPE